MLPGVECKILTPGEIQIVVNNNLTDCAGVCANSISMRKPSILLNFGAINRSNLVVASSEKS